MRQDLVKLLEKIYTKISGGFLILVVVRLIVLPSHLLAQFLQWHGNNGSAYLGRNERVGANMLREHEHSISCSS